jgi:hypothetical protein
MRQKLFWSLTLLLVGQWAQAQQFPNFKESNEADPNGWAAYGNPGYYPTTGIPGYPYGGAYYVPYPTAYYGAHVNPDDAARYYQPPSDGNGGYQPDPQAGGGYPQEQAGPQFVVGPDGFPAPPPLPDSLPPEFFSPPTADGSCHDQAAHARGPGSEKCGWASVSFLASWLRPSPNPVPLLTTGPSSNPLAGEIGQPGTLVLFGGNNVNYGMLSGIKGEVGLWLDHDNEYSIDVGGFYLFPGRKNLDVAADSAGNPVLFRPFFDVVNQVESGEAVSFPGFATGSSSIQTSAELWGAELNGRCHLCCSPRLEVEGLLGFRFLNLRENLKISDRFQPLVADVFSFQGVPIGPGDVETDFDRFATTNRFYGFQVGGQLHREFGPFYLGDEGKIPYRFYADLFTKVGLGLTDQLVQISGQTSLTTATGTSTTVPGGILALPSNIGDHSRILFGVVPEMGLNFGVEISRHWRIETGYSFLLWSGVVRPGSQISRSVNPGLVPSDVLFAVAAGPPVPNFTFHEDLFWVHNFHFGIEYRY